MVKWDGLKLKLYVLSSDSEMGVTWNGEGFENQKKQVQLVKYLVIIASMNPKVFPRAE